MRFLSILAAVAFVGTVVAANWALDTFGVVDVLGMAAPAGVFFAGLGFLLRDVVHELGGRAWVLGSIAAGAAVSYWVSDAVTIPGGVVPLAAASGFAFLLSELADFSVYAPLRRNTLAGGIVASQIVGAVVDSAVFLYLAFGSLEFFAGQTILKALMVAPAVIGLGIYRIASSRETACASI